MQVYNFSAGPAMLPVEVLHHVEKELYNWNGLGTSIMEISHRSQDFIAMAKQSEEDLRDLLRIPSNYKVLFCHGGARAQFSALPLNLLGVNTVADYIDSGYWSQSAINEAKKYCTPNIIDVKTNCGNLRGIQSMQEWQISDRAAYVHYCPNETIEGVSIDEMPDFGDKVVMIGDYSSSILSRPLEVRRFGVIYASSHKNIGPSGLTLVIIREDLFGKARRDVPSILNYTILAEHDSMFNTPPTFAWYFAGLVFKLLKKQGGLIEMKKRNQTKAELLYQTIDNSDLYRSQVVLANRSWMNVPFQLVNSTLDNLFLSKAKAIGLQALKGHRVVGGMRASIYNAMPLDGVLALIDFMHNFERQYG